MTITVPEPLLLACPVPSSGLLVFRHYLKKWLYNHQNLIKAILTLLPYSKAVI